jgi:protein tyrosine phosphatase
MLKSDQTAIFNIFHDGVFLSLEREKENMHFQIQIQYLAEMIDPMYTYFTGVLQNCRHFSLQVWNDENRNYEDIDMISSLLMNLEISRAVFENENVLVHCLSEENGNAGGSLIFSCENIVIFDEGKRKISIEELQEIYHRYWKKK